MAELLSLLLSFLTLMQPRPVHAYFSTGRATAQFVWQVGTWLLTEPEFAIEAPNQTVVLQERIQNGQFKQGLAAWQATGAVAVTDNSPCSQSAEPLARIGSLPEEQQTLRDQNLLTQSFQTHAATWLAVEYCIVSWESLPLFDEPGLQISLNDQILWEDAPTVLSTNATAPTISGWRTATLPIPSESELNLNISAGNTVDPIHPTVVYVRSISTKVGVVGEEGQLHITPSLAAQRTVLSAGGAVLHTQELAEPFSLPATTVASLPSIVQLTFTQTNIRAQTSTDSIFVLHNLAVPTAPQVVLSSPGIDEKLTAYFSAPADGDGNKLAKYTVWQQLPDAEPVQIPHTYSFTWQTPRLPGGQEYLTFTYAPIAKYAIEFWDQFGQSVRSDWMLPPTE